MSDCLVALTSLRRLAQAIHARSMIPCQDSPGVKFTYGASITVPDGMTALMSAVASRDEAGGDGQRTFHFEQKVPIPAYLVALVVGNIVSKDIGPRSRVWCESDQLEAVGEKWEGRGGGVVCCVQQHLISLCRRHTSLPRPRPC